MTWVLVIVASWVLLAALAAVLIGRSVRLADARAAREATVHEPNFVVDPATAPSGLHAATVLPFPLERRAEADGSAPPPAGRDAPTVPGLPVVRPPAPGAGTSGTHDDPIRKTGLA
jgi:hypothetical protein